MPRHCIVRTPFGDRAIGDRIEDPAEVEQLLAGPQADHVTAVAIRDPAPAEAETTEEGAH